jgi:hypothetical protein
MLRSPLRGAATLLVLAAVAASAAAAGLSGDAGSSAVSVLNAERARIAIPGALVENVEWSRRCALHNRYLALNRDFGHEENPANPGYTTDGSWAGEHSVLAFGRRFSIASFASAPLHLIQLLSPRLRQVGVAESDGFVCITTWPGYRFSEGVRGRVRVFAYPARGARDVPASEVAGEEPLVPGSFVGIPSGTRTGPYLLVFSDGGWSGWSTVLADATLRGRDGLVETRVVDRTTPGIGEYIPPGAGMVIPVRPLAPGRTYRASVTFREGRRAAGAHWSFRTRR